MLRSNNTPIAEPSKWRERYKGAIYHCRGTDRVLVQSPEGMIWWRLDDPSPDGPPLILTGWHSATISDRIEDIIAELIGM
jgi:hypothetical protein